ncbi:hypothetical protein CA13_29450 [Planctomycetes bacterium CA13]|uniref:Uncharacterized protein n=1 Tax=Novipirellula herctigrandis TaxID=2527986 RepID=A0A5C5Z285_9BACT|nr:hypothetical protein CA13_29450 [Planctomycetes bacterium CA13]
MKSPLLGLLFVLLVSTCALRPRHETQCKAMEKFTRFRLNEVAGKVVLGILA